MKKLKQIMGLAHPEEVEEAIAERPAVPSRPTTIAPEQAWVGLLLNGTVDLLFSPWFIFTSLVLDPRRACQVAAFSLFVDGLVSGASASPRPRPRPAAPPRRPRSPRAPPRPQPWPG